MNEYKRQVELQDKLLFMHGNIAMSGEKVMIFVPCFTQMVHVQSGDMHMKVLSEYQIFLCALKSKMKPTLVKNAHPFFLRAPCLSSLPPA